MARRRNTLVLAVLLVLTLIAVGAWFIASRQKTPAEMAAEAAPPPPSLLLAEAEERELRSTVVTRGNGRYGLPQAVSLPASALKGSLPGLITMLPRPNARVEDGAVLLSASGRPVLVLKGATPAYRDLVPGLEGGDVKQLEEGLARFSLDPGPVDGKFDAQTSAAVAAWYKKAGWVPFDTTPEQKANILKLEQDIDAARRAMAAAESAVATAMTDEQLACSNADQANQKTAIEVEAMADELDKAEADLVTAEQSAEAAKATADHNDRLAAAKLAAKLADRQRLLVPREAGEALTVESAVAQADHANRAAAAEIATKISDRALIVLDPRSLRTARAAADASLEVARANANNVRLQGAMAVLAARRESSLAAEQLTLAKAEVKARELEGKAAVQAALDAREAAQRGGKLTEAKLRLAKNAHETTQFEGQRAVQAAVLGSKLAKLDEELARKHLDRLTAELALARSKAGVQVPVDEIVFLPDMPVRVHEVAGVVGEPATGTLLALTDFRLTVVVHLAVEHAPKVREAMPVEILEEQLQIKAGGVFRMIARDLGTRGAPGHSYYTEIEVTEPPADGATLAGKTLRVTIPYETTDGPVLSVPINALMQTADGRDRVQVRRSNGELEYVEVTVGRVEGEGYVPVTPTNGTLEPGERVVLAYEKKQEELLDMGR